MKANRIMPFFAVALIIVTGLPAGAADGGSQIPAGSTPPQGSSNSGDRLVPDALPRCKVMEADTSKWINCTLGLKDSEGYSAIAMAESMADAAEESLWARLWKPRSIWEHDM